MLKEELVEFVETLSTEDKAQLSSYLREQDQKAYDEEGLEIARQRSEELKNGKVEGLSIDGLIARVQARRQNAS